MSGVACIHCGEFGHRDFPCQPAWLCITPLPNPRGLFFHARVKAGGLKPLVLLLKTLLCKMSICLFKGIFHCSNLNCAVKCQKRMFNEDQLEALIGWIFNGLLFFLVVVLSLRLCFRRDPC